MISNKIPFLKEIKFENSFEINELTELLSYLCFEINKKTTSEGGFFISSYKTTCPALDFDKIKSIFILIRESKINIDHLVSLQKIFLDSENDRGKYKSGYRTRRVGVASRNGIGIKENNVIYIAINHENIDVYMDDFFNFLENSDKNIFIKIALLHYQFCAIHPFEDCNGKVAKVLIFMILAEKGVLENNFYIVSTLFDNERARYYSELQCLHDTKNYERWVVYFLKTLTRMLVYVKNRYTLV